MEIELKYLVDDENIFGHILNDRYVGTLIDHSSRKEIKMEAKYYDTSHGDFQKAGAGFRVRKEGKSYVLTAKWGGDAANGMHRRNEVNVNLENNQDPVTVDFLKDTSAYDYYKELAKGKKLQQIVGMEFLREEYIMQINDTQCLISMDQGQIQGLSKNETISEIEIEISSGKEEDILAVGGYLERTYGLKPCDQSKLARGLKLREME